MDYKSQEQPLYSVWNLTANATVTKLVNNGTINTNGYTLTYGSKSGSGTINESTGIEHVKQDVLDDGICYDLQGRKVRETEKGICIKNGKKFVNR